jgi:hypothetical protein
MLTDLKSAHRFEKYSWILKVFVNMENVTDLESILTIEKCC